MDEKPERTKGHPRAVRWTHWLNIPFLSMMVWSGLLIYWANDPYRIGIGDFTLVTLFPGWFYDALGIEGRLAEGMSIHFAFMWLFALNGLVYVVALLVSGEWRELLPNKDTPREALQVVLHDLGLRKGPLPARKFNGAQRIAYTGALALGASSIATGIAIYKPVQASWLTEAMGGYEVARFLHFWTMMGFVAFVVVHVAQVLRAGWRHARPMFTAGRLGRSLAVGAVWALGLAGCYVWVLTREKEGELPWPLRRTLEFNERLSRAFFDPMRLSPERSPEELEMPRINGDIGMTDPDFDPAKWTLEVQSGPKRFTLTLADIKGALPHVDTRTDLRCIEGWSAKVGWGGVRLSEFLLKYGLVPADAVENPDKYPNLYLRLSTPDEEYYVGIDLASAVQPQTLLAYDMNGKPLTLDHGAPLRLAIPTKYGIKNIKRIGYLRVMDERPDDYWAREGYDWYAGH